jgi:beta-glucuronidase
MRRFLLPFITLLACVMTDLAPGQALEEFPQIPPSVLAPAIEESDNRGDPMVSRLFPTTSLRTQIQLGGFWDFRPDPEGIGESQQFFRSLPTPETRMWIPGTWNSYARYWQYEGPAWLVRHFETRTAGHLRIRFGGVFYRAKIWLDGRLLGEHEGGYTPFAVVARNLPQGEHKLVVLADNRLDDESLPKQGVDWFPYGGIYRPVYAEFVPATYVDNFHIVSTDISRNRAVLQIKAFLRNLDGQRREESIRLEVSGKPLYTNTHVMEGREPEISFSVVLDNPRLWSPASPFLYTARLLLSGAGDDQFTRFGIRSFTAEGNRILLNGQAFKVLGANRHDDHPDWGSALPPHIIRQDIEILKRMGANAVRSHYPTDEMFMDYCDEQGLVFLSEVPAWQYSADQLARQSVQEKIKSQFREMVYRDMSRPSILCWSLGNEWPEFRKSYSTIKALLEYARSVDSTHFLTFVTGGAQIGEASALIDIISTNWAQYQWYDPFTTLDSGEGEGSIAKLNRIRETFPDKPVLLTEFGGAEAQAGWHNWGNVKWSEEFQARNVSDSGRYGLNEEWISGGCVWQFAESRSAPSRFLGGRLRGWNGKGVLDGYRSPKLSFYKLQEAYHHHRHHAHSGELPFTLLTSPEEEPRPSEEGSH